MQGHLDIRPYFETHLRIFSNTCRQAIFSSNQLKKATLALCAIGKAGYDFLGEFLSALSHNLTYLVNGRTSGYGGMTSKFLWWIYHVPEFMQLWCTLALLLTYMTKVEHLQRVWTVYMGSGGGCSRS